MPKYKFAKDGDQQKGAITEFMPGDDGTKQAFALPSIDLSGVPILVSNSALAATGTYAQPAQDRLSGLLVTRVRGLVYTDVAGTLYMEQSADSAAWTVLFSIPAVLNDLADTGWVTITKRFYRLRYVNGAGAQTVFSLYVAAAAGVQDVRAAETLPVAQTGALPAGANTIGKTDQGAPAADANAWPMKVTGSGVTSAALQTAVGAAGNGAPMTVSGLATVAFTVSGTFVATVVFEGTTVATNPQPADWFSINAHQSGTTTVGTTATTPGIYRASVAGLVSVRARVSAWTSGAVTVTGTAVAVEDTSKVTAATLMGSILTNVEAADGAAAPTKAALVGGFDGGGAIRAFRMANAIPISAAGGQYMQAQVVWRWNGTNFDAVQNNTEGTLLASAARTATALSPTMTNYNARSITLYLNVTAASGTGGLQVQIYCKDPLSGANARINPNPTAVTASGLYVFKLGPAETAAPDTVASSVRQFTPASLPRTWLIQVSHGDATGYTYSLAYALGV